MRILVVQYKLVTMHEFMEELEEWQAIELVMMLEYAYMPQWEMTRALLMTQADPKKVKKATDLITFPWDEGYKPVNHEISDSQITALKEKAKVLSKYIQE